MQWPRLCYRPSTMQIMPYNIIMQNYSFDIINARFIAAGVAVQAKGLAYRLRPNMGRDDMRQTDYKLESGKSVTVRCTTDNGLSGINKSEDVWSKSSDYWLGRTALTDLIIRIPGEGDLLINDISMNVSLQKEVVRTALVGRCGTIKEYITDGDYQINMSVGLVAIDDDGRIIDQYPEQAVTQIRQILERPESLEVNSGFLDLFEINHITITGFSVKQMTHSNRQIIEITALSDTEYVLNAEY